MSGAAPGRETTPRASIGMPVRNGERFLREALDSWAAQDETDYELVVSDNASTDGTAAILEEYRRRDPRLRVVRRPAVVTVNEQFNDLVRWARAPYFAWAACDDLWEPGFLRELAGALDARPGCVLAYPTVRKIDERGRADGTVYYERDPPGIEPTPLGRAVGILRHARNHSLIYGLLRRDALLRTGIARPGLGLASDVALSIELAALGPFAHVPRPLFAYRVHGEALHVKRDDAIYAGGRGRRLDEATEAFLEALPLGPVERRLLRREVRIWCDKGLRPRPLLQRWKPLRWLWLRARRGRVDVERRLHGV